MEHEISKEIADISMVDPFKDPPLIIKKVNEQAKAVLRKLFPEISPDAPLWIGTRASQPRNVIDAKPDAKCRKCGSLCWVSPSSKRGLENGAIPCCLTCFCEALG